MFYFQETTKEHQMPFSKFILILLLTFTVACDEQEKKENTTDIVANFSQNEKVKSLLVKEDSLLLKPNLGLVFYQNKPYTGTSVAFYFESGNKAKSIDYVNGKKHGFYRKWFKDGLLSFESQYVAGKKDGLTHTWWKNGNLRSVSSFEKGVPHGTQKQWYISGAKFKVIQLVQGKEEGLQRSWRENGKLYNNYEAKNGRIFGLKRAALCYGLEDETLQYNN